MDIRADGGLARLGNDSADGTRRSLGFGERGSVGVRADVLYVLAAYGGGRKLDEIQLLCRLGDKRRTESSGVLLKNAGETEWICGEDDGPNAEETLHSAFELAIRLC